MLEEVMNFEHNTSEFQSTESRRYEKERLFGGALEGESPHEMNTPFTEIETDSYQDRKGENCNMELHLCVIGKSIKLLPQRQ